MNESTENIIPGDDRVEEAPQRLDFGLELRQAREAAGLTIADVSDQLKLTRELLTTLEASEVDKLPAATFTQGYLRNYARLLKLPADGLVEAYSSQIQVSEPDLTPVKGIPAQKNSHDVLVKVTSYGLMLIAFLLMALWWQQTDFELGDLPAPESVTVPEDTVEPTEMPGPLVPDDTEPMDMEPRSDLTEQPSLLQHEMDPGEPTDEQFPTDPAMVTADESGPEAIQPEPQPQVVTATPEPVVEQATAPAGTDVLIMTTTAESWTEVNDAAGRRLLFKLMQEGREYRLQGKAPFHIFLGNAPSVSVRVNDQSVDIKAYIRSNKIANLILDGDAGLSSGHVVSRTPARSEPDEPTKEDALPTTPVNATDDAANSDSSRDSMFDAGR